MGDPVRAPPILYHYTTGDALFGIVETGMLWATNLHYLNDSTEFGYALGLLRHDYWRRYPFS